MSKSTDPENFFQTTHSISEIKRKSLKSTNTHGAPIVLSSKILAIAPDPASTTAVYIAESAGTVRRVVLETSSKSRPYSGPTAPLTSLAFSPDGSIIFAGCWDKSIWSWDVKTREARGRYLGHTDFVKVVLCVRIGGVDLLVSGAADASLIVWDIATGKKLHTLRGHLRGVQDLAIDPWTYSSNAAFVTVFSAGSDREIRRWELSAALAKEIGEEPVTEHETSVYRILFDADGDLWTASADGTVKCLGRERGWKSEMVLGHADFVRDLVVDEKGGWIVTGGRDEEIKVWGRASGELHHTYSGHYEEITGLILVGQTVVSVSIDATIRQWSLQPQDLTAAKKEAENARDGDFVEEKIVVEKGIMTEEEESELAELMGESD